MPMIQVQNYIYNYIYNILLETYFDEYYDLSHAKRSKIVNGKKKCQMIQQ